MRMKGLAMLLLLVPTAPAWADQIMHEVQRSSELERTLGIRLEVIDKHDEWRARGLDGIFPIEGAAKEYIVKFQAPVTGALSDVFGLALILGEITSPLLSVPLEMRPEPRRSNEVSLQFTIGKKMLEDAKLWIRCGSGLQETTYVIRLKDHAPPN